jgi:hypothetical protein
MRAAPLSLLDSGDHIIQDCDLTNPNSVNRDCNTVYVTGLRLALQGYSPREIFKIAGNLAQTEEVKTVMDQVKHKQSRVLYGKYDGSKISGNTKGWCLHSLYCAFMALLYYNNYTDAMEWIIKGNLLSDTDTNACIAGALLGASLGFDAIMSDEITKNNFEVLLNVNTEDLVPAIPQKYFPCDFYILTQQAYDIFCC